MKWWLILLSMSSLYAAGEVAFQSKPAGPEYQLREARGVFITPSQIEPGKHYRVTFQVKGTPGALMIYGLTKDDKTTWGRIGTASADWQKFQYYLPPGEMPWRLGINVKGKENQLQIKELRLERLDDQDLAENLLPGLNLNSWRSIWGKKEAALSLEKSTDSPFATQVLQMVIGQDSGFPATMELPVVPGGKLQIEFWLKADRERHWMASLLNVKNQTIQVGKEWRKYQLQYDLAENWNQPLVFMLRRPDQGTEEFTCWLAKVDVRYVIK